MTDRKLLALLVAVGVVTGVLTGATTYALLTDTETVDVQVPDNVSAAANQPTAIVVDAGPAALETDGPNPDAPEEVPAAHELPAISPNHASPATRSAEPVRSAGG